MEPLIILFARAPLPGRVKTRLGLQPEVAAELHHAFVSDTLEMLAPFPAVELSTDQPTEAWNGYAVARSVQCPGDLGAKLYAAISSGLERGYAPVLILGSDSPTLPASHIQALLASTEPAAIGPTDDGGYYAISCRLSAPAMFSGVAWSSPETLAMTVEAITRVGLAVEIGPRWYDVDEPADLERLSSDPRLPRHSRKALADFSGQHAPPERQRTGKAFE